MKKSESIVELAKALSQFQGEVKQPKKDKTNPFFKSTYVDLAGVVTAISETATKYGLSFLQIPINDQSGRVGVVTMIMHSSGEYIETEPIYAMPGKQDPQAIGSAITYLKRYSLAAAFGITSEVDDDGEASMNRDDTRQQSQYQQNSYQNQQYQQQPTQQYQQGTNNNLLTDSQLKKLNTELTYAANRTRTERDAVFYYAKSQCNIQETVDIKALTRQQASILIDFVSKIPAAQAGA